MLQDARGAAQPAPAGPTGLVARALRSRFVRQNAVLFAGSVTAGLGGFVYHALAARQLGPDGYGELASLFAVYTVGTVGYQVLLVLTSRSAAQAAAAGGVERAEAMLRPLTRRLVVPGLAVCAVFAVASGPLAGFLHTPTIRSTAMLGPALAAAWLTAVPRGILQGAHRFALMSLSLGGEMVLRVGLLMAILAAGLWVAGALGAVVGASLLTYAAFALLLDRDSRHAAPASPPSYHLAGIATAGTVGVLLLYNSDVFLARHFLAANAAGVYASLNRVTTILLFLTTSVGQVLFPRVVDAVARRDHPARLFGLSAALVAALALAAAAVLWLSAPVLVAVLFGPGFAATAALVGFGAVAGVGLSLVNLFVQFLMAVAEWRLVPLLAAGVAAEWLLIAVWHGGPRPIAIDVLAADLGLAVCLGLASVAALRRVRPLSQDRVAEVGGVGGVGAR